MNEMITFLNARIDEDEATAGAAWQQPWESDGRYHVFTLGGLLGRGSMAIAECPQPKNAPHIARHDPARVLREVEATRADIALYAELAAEYERTRHGADMMRRDALLKALRHRVAVWADHPDYQAEWKP